MWLLEVFVMVCATASLTRLIAADDITHAARLWLTGRAMLWRFGRDAGLERLGRRLERHNRVDWCRWCAGFWVGLALAATWWALSDTPHLFGTWPADIGLVAFALRYTTGWLAGREMA